MPINTSNEWNMSDDFFKIVARQIDACLYAQSLAKADTTLYDEWHDELLKLDTLIGACLNKEEDINKREEWKDKIESELGINKSYNFNLDLDNSPKKRYELHKLLIKYQNWLLRCAYTNNLLIKTSQYDPEGLISGV